MIGETNIPAPNWHDIVAQEVPELRDIGPFPAEAIFSDGVRSERAFGGAAGMAQGPAFTASELDRIRELVKEQLIETAYRIAPRTAAALADLPLDQYHEAVADQDHARLLSKLARVLPARSVDVIRQMSFFDYAARAFGPFYLSDEENIGHEQICFRVVRPNRREDVGSLHRDAWFWDYFQFPVPPGISRVKVWVPVCGAPRQTGLLLAPGTHRQPAGYRTESVGGKLAFIPEIDPALVDLRRFAGNPGDPVMFNYDVLHVGALTRGDISRVSFEITIMFRSGQA